MVCGVIDATTFVLAVVARVDVLPFSTTAVAAAVDNADVPSVFVDTWVLETDFGVLADEFDNFVVV